jgi:hypothetical protein
MDEKLGRYFLLLLLLLLLLRFRLLTQKDFTDLFFTFGTGNVQ